MHNSKNNPNRLGMCPSEMLTNPGRQLSTAQLLAHFPPLTLQKQKWENSWVEFSE